MVELCEEVNCCEEDDDEVEGNVDCPGRTFDNSLFTVFCDLEVLLNVMLIVMGVF